MIQNVFFIPEAKIDIQDAFNWYENQRKGLGQEFSLCVEACIEIIRKNPELFPIEYKNLRKALIRRFPFEVFYLIQEDSIIIFSIFHAKRSPKIWKQRKNN